VPIVALLLLPTRAFTSIRSRQRDAAADSDISHRSALPDVTNDLVEDCDHVDRDRMQIELEGDP
jgi:hypothetical protein